MPAPSRKRMRWILPLNLEKRALTRRVTKIRESQNGSHQLRPSRPGAERGRGCETVLGSESVCFGDWRGWEPMQPQKQHAPPPSPLQHQRPRYLPSSPCRAAAHPARTELWVGPLGHPRPQRPSLSRRRQRSTWPFKRPSVAATSPRSRGTHRHRNCRAQLRSRQGGARGTSKPPVDGSHTAKGYIDLCVFYFFFTFVGSVPSSLHILHQALRGTRTLFSFWQPIVAQRPLQEQVPSSGTRLVGAQQNQGAFTLAHRGRPRQAVASEKEPSRQYCIFSWQHFRQHPVALK